MAASHDEQHYKSNVSLRELSFQKSEFAGPFLNPYKPWLQDLIQLIEPFKARRTAPCYKTPKCSNQTLMAKS